MEMIYLIYGITLASIAISFIKKGSLFLFLPLLVFSSCISSRDVQKKREAESSKTNLVDNSSSQKDSTSESSLDLNIKKTGEIILVNKDQSYTIKETFKPIDNTKLSRYNGNEFINAEITTEKTYNKKDNISHEKNGEVISLDQKSKSSKSEDSKKDIKAESENKKSIEDIESHKTTINLWWLVPIIIVILLILFFTNRAKILGILNKKKP
jgi:predicted RND superfamily exporter protein